MQLNKHYTEWLIYANVIYWLTDWNANKHIYYIIVRVPELDFNVISII